MSDAPRPSASALPIADETLRLLDRHGIQMALLGADGRVRWASESLLHSRGRDLVGKSCHGTVWRREKDCAGCAIKRVLETGEVHRFWVPATRPGAVSPRHLVMQVRAAPDAILEVIVDTGTPDEAFPDVLFRERILLHGLRHVPVGVLLLDGSMCVVAANPAALEMLHLGEEAVKGRLLDSLLPAGSFPARGQELAELLTRQSVLEEREIQLGEGARRRVVHGSLAAVMGHNHTFSAAVAILSEITREKNLNIALSRKVGELTLLQEVSQTLARTARLEQVLRVILAAVVHPDGLGLGTAGLFLVEEREGVLRGRLARLRPSGLSPSDGETISLGIESLAYGPSFAADRVLETLVKRFEVPLERVDHPLMQALHCATPVVVSAGGSDDAIEPRLTSLVGPGPVMLASLHDQGKRLGVLLGALSGGDHAVDSDHLALGHLIASAAAGAIGRSRLHDELSERLEDLHEAHARLRYLQGQLLREERVSALGDLASEIVHQIRNPLAVVGGFGRRLSASFEKGDPRASDVQIILEETQRMQGILDRMRQDVRLASIPARDAVDASELIDAAIQRYQDLAREQRVQLRAVIEDRLPDVRGNRDLLLEVLDNLLRNAFDAVEAAGRVTMRGVRLRDAVHIVVEDDGVGMSDEQLERVFEPSYTTKVGGTGLGLPLARRLVAQCGGSLTADSRPGQGATFRIILPIVENERSRTEEE